MKDASFAAVVGDGVLTALPYPDAYRRLWSALSRVLAPGARLAIRVFRRPDDGEPLSSVCADAERGRAGTFHAFKWRFAMALAHERGEASLPVRELHAALVRSFPDRAALAANTGWDPRDIDTIDVYRTSDEIYSFPKGSEVLATLPATLARRRMLEVAGYELAERCPILLADRDA